MGQIYKMGYKRKGVNKSEEKKETRTNLQKCCNTRKDDIQLFDYFISMASKARYKAIYARERRFELA